MQTSHASSKLDPKDADGYDSRGDSEGTKGEFTKAIADYDRAINLDPKDADVYYDRGRTGFLARDWTHAMEDLRHYCGLSEKDQDYSHFFIWLIRARLGETGAANKELADYMGKRPATAAGDWVSKVGGHLLGTIPEADLLAAAVSPDAQKDSGQHCEAWFYAGMKRLLAGDKETAADYFHKCLATGQKSFSEYQMAASELKALGK